MMGAAATALYDSPLDYRSLVCYSQASSRSWRTTESLLQSLCGSDGRTLRTIKKDGTQGIFYWPGREHRTFRADDPLWSIRQFELTEAQWNDAFGSESSDDCA